MGTFKHRKSIDIGKPTLCHCSCKDCNRQEPSVNAKPEGDSLMRHGTSAYQGLPMDCCLVAKKRESNYMAEKLDNALTGRPKLPSTQGAEGHDATYAIFQPRMHDLNLLAKEDQRQHEEHFI